MPKALFICGPTAIGKTTLSESIAQKHKLPIISCDSRQVYKELGVAVAKPETRSLNDFNYFEINSCSIHDEENAQTYCQRVEQITTDFKDKNLLFCGGTGFYIKCLLEGFEILPPKDDTLRKSLQSIYDREGIEALKKIYKSLSNPQDVQDLDNPQRLMRAIEIGEKPDKVEREKSVLKGYTIELIVLEMNRDQLYKRINQRVDEMVSVGLFEEAKALYPYRHLNALQTVGYNEAFKYIEGHLSYDEAVILIKQNTRRYAKRQITYFKNQFPQAHRFSADEKEKINTFVETFLQ